MPRSQTPVFGIEIGDLRRIFAQNFDRNSYCSLSYRGPTLAVPAARMRFDPINAVVGFGVMEIKVLIATLVAILLIGFSTWATAQTREPIDVAALGPQVGDRVPDFSLPDQTGQLHTLESVRGPNGTLILFHRSADW